MSIATGTGDQGDSGLIGGDRVPKDDTRLEAYGTLDELNAVIGCARAEALPDAVEEQLSRVSRWLFELGTDLATPNVGLDGGPDPRLDDSHIEMLTGWIHAFEKELPPLKAFILPGGSRGGATLHGARTVCRRAERRVVTHLRNTGEGQIGMVFLNRLSDLLFLHARAANAAAGVPDVEWHSGD